MLTNGLKGIQKEFNGTQRKMKGFQGGQGDSEGPRVIQRGSAKKSYKNKIHRLIKFS